VPNVLYEKFYECLIFVADFAESLMIDCSSAKVFSRIRISLREVEERERAINTKSRKEKKLLCSLLQMVDIAVRRKKSAAK
jgi:hypothetical protein